MKETQFDKEAIKEMESAIEKFSQSPLNQLTGQANQVDLVQEIAEISERYDIPKEDRVDFACEALDYHMSKIRMQAISDFREELEKMERLFA